MNGWPKSEAALLEARRVLTGALEAVASRAAELADRTRPPEPPCVHLGPCWHNVGWIDADAPTTFSKLDKECDIQAWPNPTGLADIIARMNERMTYAQPPIPAAFQKPPDEPREETEDVEVDWQGLGIATRIHRDTWVAPVEDRGTFTRRWLADYDREHGTGDRTRYEKGW